MKHKLKEIPEGNLKVTKGTRLEVPMILWEKAMIHQGNVHAKRRKSVTLEEAYIDAIDRGLKYIKDAKPELV